MIGVNSDTVKVEADYGAAVEALYKPWLDQIYKRSYACYASSPLEKMVFINAYISGMYDSYYNYGNRTRGWTLCPSIANIIKGGTINGSCLYGNCSSVSELVLDMAVKELGLKGELVNKNNDSAHIVARITIGNEEYICDPQVGSFMKIVNNRWEPLDFQTDLEMTEHLINYMEKYGNINYSPY